MTYCELDAGLVSSVAQLVLRGVEGEGLHDIGSGSQELAVKTLHCQAPSSSLLTNKPFDENTLEQSRTFEKHEKSDGIANTHIPFYIDMV